MIFSDDPKQILRLNRQIAAFVVGCVYSLLYVFFFYNNVFKLDATIFYTLFFLYWAGHFLFIIIIRSHANLNLTDPSLTILQILWFTIFLLIISYVSIKWRGLILLTYFGIFSFGYFKLRFREFISIGLFSIIGYLIVIIVLFLKDTSSFNARFELLQLLSFSITIFVMIYIGSAIHGLREKTRKQNVALNAAYELNKKLATTDDLTGLYNRRYFMRTIEKQKSLYIRDRVNFTICFCDMDHFKQINDIYGHHNGDIVLKKFADILMESIREIDYAARLGGEEFVCLLVNTDIDEALKVSDRIRESIANYNFSDIAPTLQATVSIGLASFDEYESIQQTLMIADDRLYRAKQLGRNKIVFNDNDSDKKNTKRTKEVEN